MASWEGGMHARHAIQCNRTQIKKESNPCSLVLLCICPPPGTLLSFLAPGPSLVPAMSVEIDAVAHRARAAFFLNEGVETRKDGQGIPRPPHRWTYDVFFKGCFPMGMGGPPPPGELASATSQHALTRSTSLPALHGT